jgi:long-chain acyl-CoA synthetase
MEHQDRKGTAPQAPAELATQPNPARVHQLASHWAALTPQAPALADERLSLSYGELEREIERVRHLLADTGVRGGDRVLLVAENHVATAVFALACSALDAWFCMVNARLSAREIDTMIDHSGARLVVLFPASSSGAAQHAERLNATSRDLGRLGTVAMTPVNIQALPERLSTDPADQVAALIYTSGTSGAPKGVMLTHANLLFIARNSCQMRHLRASDKVYGVLPLSHVYGLTAVLLATLRSGASLVLTPRFDVEHLAHALAQGGITVMHGVPAMYAKLLDWSHEPGRIPMAPTLRVAQSGGAPLDQALKDRFEATFKLTLNNGYGMTEASPSIAQTRLDAPRKDCSAGPPIPGIEVKLLDTATGQPVPAGEVGELWIKGPNVMKGYYKAKAQTAEVLTPEGWLNTGDMARLADDGGLFIVGRSKELIIRSGFNVYPVEVEQVLNAHPDITHSAVVGRTVPGNEEVVAFVEPVPGRTLDVDAIAAYLREHLSPYKLPSEIVVMSPLPALPTGKLAKKTMRDMAAERLKHSR